MDKKKVIKVLTNAAKLYKEYLENQKVLFVYGLPFEVKKQLNTTNWFFRYVTYKNQNPDFYPYVPKST